MVEAASKAHEIADDEALRLQSFQVLSRAHLELGELERALDWIGKAVALAQAQGLLVAEARSYQTMAFIADAKRAYSRAEMAHRQALELFELATPLTGYPIAEREFLGRSLLVQRKFDEAESEFQVVERALSQGQGFRQNIYDGLLACAAAKGDWLRFDVLFDRAVNYEFPPSNLNLRALKIARGFCDTNRARRLSVRIEKWTESG